MGAVTRERHGYKYLASRGQVQNVVEITTERCGVFRGEG